jgi:hypothetical protein
MTGGPACPFVKFLIHFRDEIDGQFLPVGKLDVVIEVQRFVAALRNLYEQVPEPGVYHDLQRNSGRADG